MTLQDLIVLLETNQELKIQFTEQILYDISDQIAVIDPEEDNLFELLKKLYTDTSSENTQNAVQVLEYLLGQDMSEWVSEFCDEHYLEDSEDE